MDIQPTLANIIMAAVFWTVVLWMASYVVWQIWRKFRWDLLYAGGAISILAWVSWATFEVNNLLYHTVIWFVWPLATIIVLYSTDWLAKRAKKH